MKSQVTILFVILATLGIGGCKKHVEQNTLKPTMLDVYAATVDLYSYVWSPTLYESKSAQERIPVLLDRLATDFHTVTKMSNDLAQEPGFEVTLNVQRELLNDVRRHYKAGDHDYARWRLQGMLSNCVSCHSRYKAKVDFVGDIPVSNEDTLAARFSKAQFLLATRQFETAGLEFYKLADSLGDIPSGQRYALRALKGWLVVEVRVKDRPAETARDLEKFTQKNIMNDLYAPILAAWKHDFAVLADEKVATNETPAQTIKRAQHLLSFVRKGVAEDEDEKNLVKTLRSTALLHAVLEQSLEPALRRQALLELGRAYLHLPIELFEPFRDLYLEQCIREFPNTNEAKQAFTLYKDYIEFLNSGSGGVHIDDEQNQRLEELRVLAFGK